MALTIYKKGFKMGKVEIITLIAGVVLSIALALIIVPVFKGIDEMSKKTQIKQEVISLIKHKDLWEMDKALDPSLDFTESYINHTKDVREDGGDIVFQTENKCKVAADGTKNFTIDCKIGSTSQLESYDELIEEFTKIGYDRGFIGSSDPADEKIKMVVFNILCHHQISPKILS